MIEDLEHNDRKLKKLLNMNRRLHARSNVDCMYIPRVFVGRGLTSSQRLCERRSAQCYS